MKKPIKNKKKTNYSKISAATTNKPITTTNTNNSNEKKTKSYELVM